MGCTVSTATAPDGMVRCAAEVTESSVKAPARAAIRQRSETRLSLALPSARMVRMTSTLSTSTWGPKRRSSGGEWATGRLYGMFASRNSTGSCTEGDKADPLGLGSESKAVGAPSEWLVVLGERGAGKSTLVRQLKFTYDGLEVTEARRFSREVHKLALMLFKKILDAADIPSELQEAAERIRQLKRRALITPDVCADLKPLLEQPQVQAVLDALEDQQARKAARHFASRLECLEEEEYTPDTLDLVHLAMPTVGQQETRVNGFPGNQICVYESNQELRNSSQWQGRTSMRQVRERCAEHAPRHAQRPPPRAQRVRTMRSASRAARLDR